LALLWAGLNDAHREQMAAALASRWAELRELMEQNTKRAAAHKAKGKWQSLS
jgi:hypothetical protein